MIVTLCCVLAGAELFAKRQKRSEKWVVEGPTQQPQMQQQNQQQQHQYETIAPAPAPVQQYNPYAQQQQRQVCAMCNVHLYLTHCHFTM